MPVARQPDFDAVVNVAPDPANGSSTVGNGVCCRPEALQHEGDESGREALFVLEPAIERRAFVGLEGDERSIEGWIHLETVRIPLEQPVPLVAHGDGMIENGQ